MIVKIDREKFLKEAKEKGDNQELNVSYFIELLLDKHTIQDNPEEVKEVCYCGLLCASADHLKENCHFKGQHKQDSTKKEEVSQVYKNHLDHEGELIYGKSEEQPISVPEKLSRNNNPALTSEAQDIEKLAEKINDIIDSLEEIKKRIED